jgi:MoCo/4Fe-4S cofactor protein with predicted Tat translocation signal
MKTIPPPCPIPETGRNYWRGLDELADTPEFREWVEREFPPGASEVSDPQSRRHFMKIMGASFMLAGVGLTGCRRPVEYILPFNKQPEGYTHGIPQFYATAMPTRTGAIPLVVEANEGRPTKIEGNPLHPDSNGATDRFAQAAVLGLYDPDRAMHYKQGGKVITEAAAMETLKRLADGFAASGGAGLCFLLERNTSPTRARVQALLARKLPQARWFVYEPVDFDIYREGATVAFGQPVKPQWKLDQAKRIVSLDCDFLGGEEDLHRTIRDFARGRKVAKADQTKGQDLMNRLYVVEGLMTLTGANGDHHLRVAPSAIVQVAAALAAAIGGPEFAAVAASIGKPAGVDDKWISECAKDLKAHAGACAVVAGHRQPLAVHVLAHAMNAALGNVGKTVELLPAPTPTEGGLADLHKLLVAGTVTNLVILGGNPVYNAPADLDWRAAQRKAKNVIRLGYYEDETAEVADWTLPLLHFLESWSDARTSDGTLVPVQPLIAPLFRGMTEAELLARLAGENTVTGHALVRETFRAETGGGEEVWKKFLHDGFQPGTAAKPVTSAKLVMSAVSRAHVVSAVPVGSGKYEVIFHRDYSVDDGRYCNNGWLQEMPDPVTKTVWENVILLSPATYKQLGLKSVGTDIGLKQEPVVEVEVNGRKVSGPAWSQPGLADNVVGLALGYGRPKAGRIGSTAGYDAYAVRTTATLNAAVGAEVRPIAGKRHPVSTTQSHWKMEGRPVVREANLEEYLEHPKFASLMNMHEPPGGNRPLYPNPLDEVAKTSPYAWGMSIDLNSCVGCQACVMACQSENNIPIVGKQQVGRSREMHWLRLDRYYAGPVENPQVVMQPMLCQHCESAPCESVCPVNATVHDEDGLNVMAYNRCVGTRYCSNNCPYKVRRFNFFDYNKRAPKDLAGPVYASPLFNSTNGEWDIARWWRSPENASMRPEEEWELLKLAKNPQVSVRMRGIMEKCTFCVQRIEQSKINQKIKARDSGDVVVPDGTVKTACQQVCPAEAISFGNLKDANSQVSQARAADRTYQVLEFLLTKPRVTYLARVRNPNPLMPDHQPMPFSLQEYADANGNPLKSHGPDDANEAAPKAGQGGGH